MAVYQHRRADGRGANRRGGTTVIFRTVSTDLVRSEGGGWISGPRLTFGYCLARDTWGRGYATEAASKFLAIAFEDPKIWRVQAHCDLENRASAHVLEKIGLALECVQRRYMVLPNLGDVPRDLYTYVKVREAVAA